MEIVFSAATSDRTFSELGSSECFQSTGVANLTGAPNLAPGTATFPIGGVALCWWYGLGFAVYRTEKDSFSANVAPADLKVIRCYNTLARSSHVLPCPRSP